MKNINIDDLRERYERGDTIVDIAEHFNVSTACLYGRFKKLDWHRSFKQKNIEDISGQRFGKLVALKFEKLDRFGKALWLVRCDCGKEKIINASGMKANLVKSCGCYKHERLGRGVGSLSRAYWRKLEKSAVRRGFEFSITQEYAWSLFLEQNQLCALSGVPIVMFQNWDRYRLQTASLDRIDSTKGYVLGNVQWVHKRINFLKRDYSEEELIFWCVRVAEQNKDKYVDITGRIPIERRKHHEIDADYKTP
jgi:hypothetical protein